MYSLIPKNINEVPATIEELKNYILIGQERLKAYQAKVRAIEKIGLAKAVKDQALQEAQDVATAVLDAEARLGELLKDRNLPVRTSAGTFDGRESLPSGITKKQSHFSQQLADNRDH